MSFTFFFIPSFFFSYLLKENRRTSPSGPTTIIIVMDKSRGRILKKIVHTHNVHHVEVQFSMKVDNRISFLTMGPLLFEVYEKKANKTHLTEANLAQKDCLVFFIFHRSKVTFLL